MNEKLNEIIKNLKSQNDNSAELINALETLDNILRKVYHLNRNIVDKEKMVSIDNIVASIDTFNLKYKDSLDIIVNLSNEVNKITQSFEDRASAQIGIIKKQNNKIDNMIQTYDTINVKANELGRICTRVNKEINKIDTTLSSKLEQRVESLIDKSEDILNKINTVNNDIDSKINILDEKISKLEALNNNITKKINGVEVLINEIKSEKLLGEIKDNIEEVMLVAEYINDAFEKQRKKNENEINGFEYLANNWAEENIHSLALRKKK